MLPNGWRVQSVLELGRNDPNTVQTGPFGSQLHAEDYAEEGIPLLLIRNIGENGLVLDGLPRISEQDAARLARYALQPGDIVFSRVGRVGSCFLATEDQEGWIISGQTLRIRLAYDDLNPHYFLYALRNRDAQDFITGASVGTTRSSINTSILKYLPVRVPSYPEQVAIADILSTVDQAIEQTEALIAKQRRIKAGLLHDLLTRGIDEHGRLRDPSTHRFKPSPVGLVPEEWEVEPLYRYLSFISYGFTNPMPETFDGPYLVTAANIVNGRIDYASCRHTSQEAFDRLLTPKSRPIADDILLTKDGTLGRLALVDGTRVCINQSVAVLRTNDRIEPQFLKMVLEAPDYQARLIEDSGGSTIKHLYVSRIDKMPVAVPSSVEERQRIAKLVATQTMITESDVDHLGKLGRLKTGLMQDLLSGRVSVAGLARREMRA